MLSRISELSVTLWSEAPHATEQLSSRIQALAPRAQVKAGAVQSELCVKLDDGSSDAVKALTSMLEKERDTLVYSYHWYRA